MAASVHLLWKYIQFFCQSVILSGEICDATEDDIFGKIGELSEQFSNGEVGVFKGMNATMANSNFVINNGRYEHHKFNEIVKFNGKTSTYDIDFMCNETTRFDY